MLRLKVNKTSSEGIVSGPVIIWQTEELQAEDYFVEETERDAEIGRFEEAVESAVQSLETLAEKNEIFEAHIQAVKDPSLAEEVREKITVEGANAQKAVQEVCEAYISIFESMDDEYMKERSADIRDIQKRLMRILKGKEAPFGRLANKGIVIAKDLTPSDTAQMDLSQVLGFVTRDGGVTSHVCIMARNIGLPALVGVKDILNYAKDGDFIILDAGKGEIILNPDDATAALYERLQRDFEEQKDILEQKAKLPAKTKDGYSVEVYANVGDRKELEMAQKCSADGIGLFRSEFLYMDNDHFPTEDEQFKAYKAAAAAVEKEVIIRTLDIGGDKKLSYFEFEKEENPFLGFRAIRISLSMKEMFQEQLRGILRASAYGNVKIMFPMIISLEELAEAKEMVECAKSKLRTEGTAFNENIAVGVMIETPASVLMAEELAQNADFFSIGTNDLTQYILAADRGNERISNLYNPFHPAVLRSIKYVIEAGHKAGIPVGMCGEFASDEKAVKLLLGMGLDEFSMSSPMTVKAKNAIRNTSLNYARTLAGEVLKMSSADEIENYLWQVVSLSDKIK